MCDHQFTYELVRIDSLWMAFWYLEWMCIRSSSSEQSLFGPFLTWLDSLAHLEPSKIGRDRCSYFRAALVECPFSDKLSSSSRWPRTRRIWQSLVWKCSQDWLDALFIASYFQVTYLRIIAYSYRTYWNDFELFTPHSFSRKTVLFGSSNRSCWVGLTPFERGSCCSKTLTFANQSQIEEYWELFLGQWVWGSLKHLLSSFQPRRTHWFLPLKFSKGHKEEPSPSIRIALMRYRIEGPNWPKSLWILNSSVKRRLSISSWRFCHFLCCFNHFKCTLVVYLSLLGRTAATLVNLREIVWRLFS